MRGHFLRAALAGAVGGGGYDTDAQTWFTAVEAADANTLEAGVKDAVDDFITGCKTDGSWAKITQLFLMAGPRTKAGALVPVVGPVYLAELGTHGNPLSHSRTDGLVNTNSINRCVQLGVTTADFGQNDHHMAMIMADGGTSGGPARPWLGTTASDVAGSSRLSPAFGSTDMLSRSWGVTSTNTSVNPRVNFFIGQSRTASGAWVSIRHTTVQALTTASTAIAAPASFYLLSNAGTSNAATASRARLLVMGTGMSQADFEQLRTRCVAYSDAIIALSLG